MMVMAVALGLALMAYAAVTAEGVRNRLSSKIREAWKVVNLDIKVVPFESDYWTQQGRFQALVISADNIGRKGIIIRNAYVKGYDVTLDLAKLYQENDVETKSVKKTDFTARVYRDDLNKLLALREMPIQNAKVEFEDGKLVFTGKYTFGVGHNLRMAGELRVQDHSKVNFVPTAASVNGIPLPAGPLRGMLNKLNPLIDFKTLPLKPTVDEVKLVEDYILVKG